ncbi:MAG TPA: hypothetical protein VFV97_06665, partial [Rhodanobacteraceae bacterium]|nr:hypothetical protein [Rhodanobacteraceae bacterium]
MVQRFDKIALTPTLSREAGEGEQRAGFEVFRSQPRSSRNAIGTMPHACTATPFRITGRNRARSTLS